MTDEVPRLLTGEQGQCDLQCYNIISVFEDGYDGAAVHPLVDQALKVHAGDYLREAILTDEAIDTTTGWVIPEIDHMRGPNVEYIVALDSGGGLQASLRKMHPDNDGTGFHAFPSFERTQQGMTQNERTKLEELSSKYAIVEIGGLSKIQGASTEATLEVYRRAIHDSIRRDEVWFMGIVPETHKMLRENFGGDVIEQLGEPVYPGEKGISSEISLTPVLIQPQTILERFLTQMQKARTTGNKVKEWSARQNLIFFADGLSPEEYALEESQQINIAEALQKIFNGQDPLSDPTVLGETEFAA